MISDGSEVSYGGKSWVVLKKLDADSVHGGNALIRECVDPDLGPDTIGTTKEVPLSELILRVPGADTVTISAPPKTRGIADRSEIFSTLRDMRDSIGGLVEESFPDESGRPWAYYRSENGRHCLAEIRGEAFADWVRLYIHEHTDQPREAWVDSVVKYFASRARQAQKRALNLRRGEENGAWYFQTGSDTMLRIKEGQIREFPIRPIFRVFSHQNRVEVDLFANIRDIDLLDRYLNLTNRWEVELFKSVLPAYCVPNIQKPLLLARGEPGSAKSTFGRILKRVVDPSSMMNAGIKYPAEEKDWATIARHHEVILLDNLGHLSKGQQDELCATVTGRDIGSRKLYTDDDMVGTRIQRIVAVNGIDFSHLNADFIDRSYIGDMRRIPPERQIPETEFWADFERDLPRIRGAIFHILAQAQGIAREIKPPRGFRLMDFARYAAACAQARGQPSAEFLAQLTEKTDLQGRESIAQNPVVEPLKTLMLNRETWEGKAGDLLRELTEQEYGVLDYNGERHVRNVPKDWGRTPQWLGVHLGQIAHLLPRVGLSITDKTIQGTKILKIMKIHPQHPTLVNLSSGVLGPMLENATYHPHPPIPPQGPMLGMSGMLENATYHPAPVVDKNGQGPMLGRKIAKNFYTQKEEPLSVTEEAFEVAAK